MKHLVVGLFGRLLLRGVKCRAQQKTAANVLAAGQGGYGKPAVTREHNSLAVIAVQQAPSWCSSRIIS